MKISDMTKSPLERFHRDQGGAVALVMLAAFLALFMMGMVVYDANMSVADSLDVQAAADSASWSQSTIESRTMNMVAFTNVGKRVTVGFTSMYQAAIWANYAVMGELLAAMLACWAANAICPGCCGCLTALCRYLTNLFKASVDIYKEEKDDIDAFNDELLDDYFGADVQALDNYQNYMIDITPWWAWAEGTLRGVQNGATVTATFPTPDTLSGGMFSGFVDMAGQSDVEDELPVERGDYDDGMCDDGAKSGWPDYGVHNLEFAGRSLATTSGQYEPVVMALIIGHAAALYGVACKSGNLSDAYGSAGAPIEVKSYGSESQWNMFTSNLTLAYYADKSRMEDSGARKKYGFVPTEYKKINPILQSSGYWAWSRSEISYRGDQSPNEWKWNPKWTARMRPVALPGEWGDLKNFDGDEIAMKNAWRDLGPLLIATGSILNATGISNGQIDFGQGLIWDATRMDSAAGAMDDENIEGTPK